MPEFDKHKAAERLEAAITEAYGKPGLVRNHNQLHLKSGLSRSVIEGWLVRDTQPEPDTLQRAAEALGVPVEHLWLRWLGYEPPEPGLTRIADEIELLRLAISAAGGEAQSMPGALAAIDAAREDPDPAVEVDPPSEPVAASRRRRPGA